MSRVPERGAWDQVLADYKKMKSYELGKSCRGEKQSNIHHGKA
jgi:hypothetical protein